MPPDQGSVEREEIINSRPETPGMETPITVEPPRGPEIVPPPEKKEGGDQNQELGEKAEALERHAEAARNRPGINEVPEKTIDELAAELSAIIDRGDVDSKETEKICGEIVFAIVGDGDKSPEKIKDELIHFAEKNFPENGKLSFDLHGGL